MPQEAAKRVCLLTGAGGTLGQDFCERYRKQYHIAAVCRTRVPRVPTQDQRVFDPLDPTRNLSDNDDAIYAIKADLGEEAQLERVVELTLARFGRIDLLVNAAVHFVQAPFLDSRLTSTAELQFRINVLVPLKLTTLVAEKCWRDHYQENLALRPHVVNISSNSGLHIYAGHGQGIYSATKAALNFLTCHMAEEFQRRGIRVNALVPDSFPQGITTAAVNDAIVRLKTTAGHSNGLCPFGGGQVIETLKIGLGGVIWPGWAEASRVDRRGWWAGGSESVSARSRGSRRTAGRSP